MTQTSDEDVVDDDVPVIEVKGVVKGVAVGDDDRGGRQGRRDPNGPRR